MGADLTVNQKKFANEYVIDGNVSRAYKAAELLGKHYGLFTDKINLEGNIPVMIVDDLGSDVGE